MTRILTFLVILAGWFSVSAQLRPAELDLHQIGWKSPSELGCKDKFDFTQIEYLTKDTFVAVWPSGCSLDRLELKVFNQAGRIFAEKLFTDQSNDGRLDKLSTYSGDQILLHAANRIFAFDKSLNNVGELALHRNDQLLRLPDDAGIALLIPDGDDNNARIRIYDSGARIVFEKKLDLRTNLRINDPAAINSKGDFAYNYFDYDKPLQVISASHSWPKFTGTEKDPQPLLFINENLLLLRSQERHLFPSEHLYLWSSNGTLRRIKDASADYYIAPVSSVDGKRVLLSEMHDHFITEMINGFDCGPCAETTDIVVIDIAKERIIFRHRQAPGCSDAFSPAGDEIAETCNGKLKWFKVQ